MMTKVSDLFRIAYGSNLEFNKTTPDDEGIPFVARGAVNNGVVGYVKPMEGAIANPANTISVSAGGSVLECFLQEKEYYSGRDLFYLEPLQLFTKSQMIFYCIVLRSNKYKYSYGRQANRTLGDIAIPAIEEIPQWVNDLRFPSPPSEKPYHHKLVSFKDREWELFNVRDLFPVINKCKCSSADRLVSGDDINHIGAKKSNNGVVQRVRLVPELVSKGNAIVFIGNGAGSVGYTLYQKEDFIGSADLACGYNDHLNEYIGLFLVTVLDLERYRFSFGRKYGKKQIQNMRIKLPANSKNDPDWAFMEYYIKSLPFSSNLKTGKGLSDSELVDKYESGRVDFGKTLRPVLAKAKK
jgi:hypothetical protein